MSDVDKYFSVKPWHHQRYGVEQAIPRIAPGTAFCVTSPTGGGKSKIMEALSKYGIAHGLKVDIKVHRKMLLKQLVEVFQRSGMDIGVRAASRPDLLAPHKDLQISSMQTDHSRCMGEGATSSLHNAGIVLVDEAHVQMGGSHLAILRKHMEMGGCVIGITATPLGMSHFYKDLVVAGTNSELRKCGAHVPCIIKAPFEFDLSNINREKTGEFRIGDATKTIFSQAVIGKIIDEYKANNPTDRPTVLFAPDVKSSIWMAEQFCTSGVTAAHIDGGNVWFDGASYADPDGKRRDELVDLFRAGEIKVLTNRFVMREGIDLPFIFNIITACPFGNIRSFLQAVGRGLRYSPETPDYVLLTDHGGNVWRYNSPNMDRDWAKLFWMSDEQLFEEEKKNAPENNPEEVPIRCPKCGTLRKKGPRCPEPPIGCGHEGGAKSKVIIQKNGKLRTVSDEELKKKLETTPKTPQQLWDNFFFSYRKSTSSNPKIANMTFKQAFALFKRRHGFYPPFTLRNTPRFSADNAQTIRNIDFKDLK